MLHAPAFKDLEENIRIASKPLCCILFAPIFDPIGIKEVVPRLGYLDARMSDKIHFYCVGYGGYWPRAEYPDMKELGEYTYKDGTAIPWAFSQMKFAEFVDEMEENTSWKYSGGTELIILNPNADFSNAIIFKVDDMIRDGVINKSYELFEALIQRARIQDTSVQNFSRDNVGKQSAESLLDSIKESLPGPLKYLSKMWTKGKHYTLDDIS